MESQPVVLQVGVKVLLKNQDGKFLLVRRNPKKYPEVGAKWDIVGGRIEPGTPLFENLKREVKEEVGLDLTSDVKLMAAQDILKAPGRHVVRLTYVGEITGQPANLEDDHLEVKWFSAEEISRMTDDILDSFLKELLDEQVIVL